MQSPQEIRPDVREEPALVSCLCVTEGRPAFLPWLLWNYEKQSHPARELVVVDGSSDVDPVLAGGATTLVRCPPGTSVARKRNLAVEAARGTFLTWFDDDDWQHPRKLSLLAAALGEDEILAGPRQSWFVDLRRGRARPHTSHRTVLFNGIGVRRDALAGVTFDESRTRAADTAWLAAVRRHARRSPVAVAGVLSFWLCHGGNLSNPASRYVFSQPVEAVRTAVGDAAWADTDERLAELRARL